MPGLVRGSEDGGQDIDKQGKKSEDAPAVPRRHPSRIPRLFERKDAAIVREAHINYYGFDVSARWVADLAAFIAKPGKMPQMLESGDAEIAREQIRSVYGVDVSTEYATDLIAYARQQTRGNDD